MSGCLSALHYLQLEKGVSHPLGIKNTFQVILRICAPVCTHGAEAAAVYSRDHKQIVMHL